MPHASRCEKDSARDLLQNVLKLSKKDVDYLQIHGIISNFNAEKGDGDIKSANGCWMPRRVDAMSVIVVDALRFDFAVEHLPNSIGSRIKSESNHKINDDLNKIQEAKENQGRSQLLRFVADPPTVTMQRLKGLTTGGLPTFADISGSFGGANVDEDSWIQQHHDVSPYRRGYKASSRNESTERKRFFQMAFVGDDTWIDLFPTQFDEAHPFPSFNTRDLDTVDNGCIEYLPRYLSMFGSTNHDRDSFLEVMVAHFLGVDHVGHTYGPHNPHMEQKLHQMDDILNTILSQIDSSTNCEVAFIFGDHGMTEDGNHGGGTYDETNAGLFAHYSPNCGDFGPSLNISGQEVGSYSNDAFQSINQIDLVPTISLLLGLPIPYANLGGVVPALLPPLQHKPEHIANELVEAPFTATALALNAAQVWNYLTTYSSSANKLPQEAMSEIESILSKATDRLRDAISGDGFDSISYREACGLYKYFLSQATDLGKQVWTRFDTFGMGIGIILLISSLMMRVPFLSIYPTFAIETIDPRSMKQNDAVIAQRKRLVLSLMTLIFVVFHCMIMTFSNSYILSEQSIVIFMVSFLCTIETVFRFIFRVSSGSLSWMHVLCPILTMLCVRINSFVTGHGQDPMIRKYWAHHTHIFLMSLFVLVITRVSYFLLRTKRIRHSIIHSMLDITALSCLAISWIEKRSSDIARHGYRSSAIAISLCAVGILLSAVDLYSRYMNHRNQSSRNDVNKFHDVNVCLFHFLIFTVTVTGPSAATSSLLILIHTYVFWFISNEKGVQKIQGHTLALIWRLSIRGFFFTTGHACSFNRLQLSAAFVATEIFYFTPAGISLFANTFGWDIMGIIFAAKVFNVCDRIDAFHWFCVYQLLETIFSCISVSIMRRHLMVWAIFAPRFVFSSILLLLSSTFCLLDSTNYRRQKRVDKSK